MNSDRNPDRAFSVARVVESLPEAIAALFQRLMSGPRLSREELRRRVATYLVSVEVSSRDVDHMDVDTAQAIANRCHRLIDTLTVDSGEQHRRMVQAAVLYFVMESDAEDDRESLIGFEDDKLVVEAACRELGV
ncbi:MAG: hypothetical protein OEU49_02095 [Chromatiales bacterium]|nr:hypothetical protein [Chromatiales bacterium]MDH4029616.1 hypothetical protein [Chromatiales bacterium]